MKKILLPTLFILISSFGYAQNTHDITEVIQSDLSAKQLFVNARQLLATLYTDFNKELDDDIGYNIISKLRSNNMDKIVKIITNIGGTIVIGIVTIISLFIFRNKKINICIVLNLLGIVVLNNVIIKNIIGRDRPSDINIITEAGKSFPSGHSAVSMVVYGYLIYLTYNYIKNKKIKYLLISILSILILVVGLTRIYLGVHYTSDVLGGYLLGIVYLLLFTYISDKYIKEK